MGQSDSEVPAHLAQALLEVHLAVLSLSLHFLIEEYLRTPICCINDSNALMITFVKIPWS